MRIIYTHADNCLSERKYITRWLFEEVFGLSLVCRRGCVDEHQIEVEGDPRRRILMADNFFSKNAVNWLSEESLPKVPLEEVSVENFPEAKAVIGHDKIPLLFGSKSGKNELFSGELTNSKFELDVFGSLFFLISRYEEAVIPDRDEHDRFPAASSVMGQAGLLGRAVGNEYIEILWAAMKRLWPGLGRKKRSFRVLPSHDIDHPSAYWRRSLKRSVRVLGRGTLSGRWLSPFKQFTESIAYPRLGWRNDPYDTIDALMDLSEEKGLTSAFYYIPEATHPRFDPGMPITHPQVEAQWKRIRERGHEIGVHPGYSSVDQPERIVSDAKLIRARMEAMGIEQDYLGGRQHYLRWKTPETARAWSEAGLDYDSTLGFAEQPGFRCGICYEFPMFDVVKRCTLGIRQRPLVLMECSVMDERYMGYGANEKSLNYMLNLKRECQKYNGDFTVLWHNQRFIERDEKSTYSNLLAPLN